MLCSSLEKVFYTDDRQGRASETGQCECVVGDGGVAEGGREGEKVKESITAALPLLNCSYKSNGTRRCWHCAMTLITGTQNNVKTILVGN